MSLHAWLTGGSPKPGSKRKLPDNDTNDSPRKKFSKEISQNSFDWYQKDSENKWHCALCRSSNMDNAYSRGHEKPAKTTNHVRHASSQHHLTAVTKSKLSTQQPLQKLLANKMDRDEEIITQYLKCAYYLAKRELPKEEFPHIINLLSELGCQTLSDGNSYTCPKSVSEFQSVCAKVVSINVIEKVLNAGVFSLMLDESTDRGNRKRLLVYIQYLHERKLQTSLLSNIEILTAKADAETITNHVLTELRMKGLSVAGLVGIGTDGANVMTGKKSGVVVRLREHSPTLIGTHCAAHRCALAASQASKSIPELKKYSDTVSNIFFYFSGSALRSNKLREIQMLLNLPMLKFAQLHSVRWLSLQKSVEILYRTYPALLVALEHEGTVNPAARGIYAEVSQYSFIAITHMLMDILPFLGKLSRIFQTKDLDLSKVTPIVKSTCDALLDFKEAEGMYVDKLDEFIIKDGDSVLYRRPDTESRKSAVQGAIEVNMDGFSGFEKEHEECNFEEEDNGVQIRYYQQQQNVLRSIMPKYLDTIVAILENRFQENGFIEKIQVLQPIHITAAHKKGELAKYGSEEIAVMANHFAIHGINPEETPMEYKQYKRLVVGSYQTSSLSDMCFHLGSEYEDIMPNIVRLIHCCTVIPVSSATCERGFSTQNRIKSRLRTNLNNISLNDLMRISEDGPSMAHFDFPEALKVWKEEKKRKIFAL